MNDQLAFEEIGYFSVPYQLTLYLVAMLLFLLLLLLGLAMYIDIETVDGLLCLGRRCVFKSLNSLSFQRKNAMRFQF